MVKYFSVDWLARSHHDGSSSSGATAEESEDATEAAAAPTCRPHVPCVVQPRQPLYGKGYLQPKPRATKPTEPCVDSPAHPATCASPISELSGYSSGYESEAASSECPSVDEGSEAEKDGPQRRVRTKFTPEQISKLEKVFNKHKYLDAGERVKTAHKLGLTETQVRTWFQNRRMKLKREVQDLAPHAPQVVFHHLPPVQYHSMAGQRPHYSPAFYPALPVPQLVFQQQLPPHRPSHLMVHNPHFY